MATKRICLALIVAAIVASPMTINAEQPSESENAVTVKAAKVKIMEGSWIATISAPGLPPFKALLTFTQDGCLLVSQATIVPFPPPIGVVVGSAGHGEWELVSNGVFSFTFVALMHDQNAAFLGTSQVSGTIRVDGTMGDFSGTATAADLDANGNVMFSFDATIEAKRIRARSSAQ